MNQPVFHGSCDVVQRCGIGGGEPNSAYQWLKDISDKTDSGTWEMHLPVIFLGFGQWGNQSLNQWLAFKRLGITYLGKIEFKLLFHGPLAE